VVDHPRARDAITLKPLIDVNAREEEAITLVRCLEFPYTV
jgi:hypothetical protein